jgi:predicted Holliday junction resolvase-like endonuclease
MLELILALISIALFLALLFLIKKLFSLRATIERLKFEKGSQSVKYGKMTEQFIPFMEKFPFNPEQFHFLGSPIDGILFDEDQIIFCEFKTGQSALNQRQRQIKQLVKEKAVKWFEFRVK